MVYTKIMGEKSLSLYALLTDKSQPKGLRAWIFAGNLFLGLGASRTCVLNGILGMSGQGFTKGVVHDLALYSASLRQFSGETT